MPLPKRQLDKPYSTSQAHSFQSMRKGTFQTIFISNPIRLFYLADKILQIHYPISTKSIQNPNITFCTSLIPTHFALLFFLCTNQTRGTSQSHFKIGFRKILFTRFPISSLRIKVNISWRPNLNQRLKFILDS